MRLLSILNEIYDHIIAEGHKEEEGLRDKETRHYLQLIIKLSLETINSAIKPRQEAKPNQQSKVFEMLAQSHELRDRVEENTRYFRQAMTAAGFTLAGQDHPISPVMLGDAALSQKFSDRLLDHGVYAIGFFFPVVPRGTARIRTQISAAHTKPMLDQAIDAFIKVKAELGV